MNAQFKKGVLELVVMVVVDEADIWIAGLQIGEMQRIAPEQQALVRALDQIAAMAEGVAGKGDQSDAGMGLAGRNRADGQHSDSVPPALQSAGISDLRKTESRFSFST